MPNFTVCLSEEEAARARSIVEPYGGTVGGFCTSVIRDHVALEPDQLRTVRQQVQELAHAARIARRNPKQL